MKYPRFIQKKIEEALKDTPVVFLNGPRQSGKSTLVHHIAEDHLYITLDDLMELEAAKAHPQSFFNRKTDRMIIDEIQRAPELFIVIKKMVDENRTSGKFLLTGSSNVLLLPTLSDSLAGRMEILTLFPLSSYELQKLPVDLISLFFQSSDAIPKQEEEQRLNQMLRGGYPEIQERENPQRQTAWFQSYLKTILERDVRDLSQIEGLTRLPHLLKILATRSGNLLNVDELGRSSGIASSTLKRYLTLLRTVFLVHLLPPWSNNQGKRLVKSPKVYLNDTGILAYLLGLDLDGIRRDPKSLGKIVETYVINEFLKQATWSQIGVNLYYYRTVSGYEVDLILETQDGRIIGIEVKASEHINSDDFKGLKHLQKEYPDIFQHGYVLYLGNQVIPFGEKISALPLPF